MCVFCLQICLCTTYMPDAHGGQKSTLDALELELQSWAATGVPEAKPWSPGRAMVLIAPEPSLQPFDILIL